jgi:hypothetical protein
MNGALEQRRTIPSIAAVPAVFALGVLVGYGLRPRYSLSAAGEMIYRLDVRTGEVCWFVASVGECLEKPKPPGSSR